MFCPQCGKENTEQSRFCHSCGAALGSTQPAEDSQSTLLPQNRAPSRPATHISQSSVARTIEHYAGFWQRFLAYILDLLLLAVPLGMLGFLFGAFTGIAGSGSGEASASGLISLINFVASWLYFALMESSSRQATIGKMALGIIVTDLDGNRIGFGRATGRYFAKILSALPFLIGYLLAAFNARKQALHDLIARTLVVTKA
jgi:uncharacterized RDD family membrane protein YckC